MTEGLEIQRYVAARRIVFMPCHQYRFSPLWRTASQLVHEDQIGHIHLAQFEVFRLHADPGNKHWITGWRTDPRIGGGSIIFDIGTHYFDLVLSLFGPS
ncbi:MAG: Gfo/Idh/MocA family protein, partial [bacterium]